MLVRDSADDQHESPRLYRNDRDFSMSSVQNRENLLEMKCLYYFPDYFRVRFKTEQKRNLTGFRMIKAPVKIMLMLDFEINKYEFFIIHQN